MCVEYLVIVGLHFYLFGIVVALTGIPIGHSVIVALTGLPIRYSVK